MAKLKVLDGGDVEFELGARTTIGRLTCNSIRLPYPPIAKEHASLERTAEGRYVVHDLASLNGTYVNETKIRSNHRLEDGDVITVGESHLLFVDTATRHRLVRARMEPPRTEDPAAWLVYADWLQMQPEEHWRALGEFLVLEHMATDEAARQRRESLVTTYRDAWEREIRRLRPHVGHFGTSVPFLKYLCIRLVDYDASAWTTLLETLLRHPLAARIVDLELELAAFKDPGSVRSVVEWLVESRLPSTLRGLGLRDLSTRRLERLDITPLWNRLALERLDLDCRRLSLGTICAPSLRGLRIAHVDAQFLFELSMAQLPNLTDLRVALTNLHNLAALVRLLDGTRLPSLRWLKLAGCYGADNELTYLGDILRYLPAFRIISRLERLELSAESIAAEDLPALARHRAVLAHIPCVRIHVNVLSERAGADHRQSGEQFRRLIDGPSRENPGFPENRVGQLNVV
jgi:FHA domain-containing protein